MENNNKYKEFLFYKLDKDRNNNQDFYVKELPKYIISNLKNGENLREYQKEAFCNFFTFLEDDRTRKEWLPDNKNLQLLFHMATGSGKTLMMAGLILYLYREKGYRNFLFFVDSLEIIEKTITNFTEKKSNKYLFKEYIIIDGKEVFIKKVNNFGHCDKNAINICFTSVQLLANRFYKPKENELSELDFADKKVVMIADEAHHLGKTIKLCKEEDVLSNFETLYSDSETKTAKKIASEKAWYNVVHKCLEKNKENILLEFTATCAIDTNKSINEYYRNKIIYNYPLYRYQEDGYSKEIRTFKTPVTLDKMDRALIACVFNEFRQLIFSNCLKDKIYKPVVLFKCKYSDETFADNRKKLTTKYLMEEFIDYISKLTIGKLKEVFNVKNDDQNNHYIKYMIDYIENNSSWQNLLISLKNDFARERIIYANDSNKENISKYLNSLEDKDNEYRAIFDCKTLVEGWDVLNLYDIVRLYENANDSRKTSTTEEVQLIGRGARYYPFKYNKNDDEYKRKFSNDMSNPLYFCETMFYHCYNDSAYILELRKQLKENGILNFDDKIVKKVKLKKEFLDSKLYKNGYFFANDYVENDDKKYNVKDLFDNIVKQTNGYNQYAVSDDLFGKNDISDIKTKSKSIKIKDIAKKYYYILRKHTIGQNINLRFDELQKKYRNLKTLEEFLCDKNYLGDLLIEIISSNKELNFKDFNIALPVILKSLNEAVKNETKSYGSKEFHAKSIKDTLKESYEIKISPEDESNSSCGVGVSQMSPLCDNFKNGSNTYDMRIQNFQDEDMDWYVFEDNIGTSAEKAFVYEFRKRFDELDEHFDEIRLIRNEKKLKLYRFEDGVGFEPDFILVLKDKKKNTNIQIFFEPKGMHLLKYDNRKEKFLFAINEKGVKVEKVNSKETKLKGAPFISMDYETQKNFNDFIDKLIKDYG